MKIIPDPVITTAELSQDDGIHKIIVGDEEVFDFDLSQGWFVSKVSVTKNKRALVITVERFDDEH